MRGAFSTFCCHFNVRAKATVTPGSPGSDLYMCFTGADIVSVETVINPIPINWSTDEDNDQKQSPDVVPFLLSIRLVLLSNQLWKANQFLQLI